MRNFGVILVFKRPCVNGNYYKLLLITIKNDFDKDIIKYLHRGTYVVTEYVNISKIFFKRCEEHITRYGCIHYIHLISCSWTQLLGMKNGF